MTADKHKATGYDKYIDWRVFIFPVLILVTMLVMPPLEGIKDVGTEYALGEKAATEQLAQRIFQKPAHDLEQWQLLTVRMMEKSMRIGAMSREGFLARDVTWCKKQGIVADKENHAIVMQFVSAMDDESFKESIVFAAVARNDVLTYDSLSEQDKETADQGVWNLQVALAMMVFVVICFITGCVPLPAVAFCIGLLLVFTGVVTRTQVAAMYWSDACYIAQSAISMIEPLGFDHGLPLIATATVLTGGLTQVMADGPAAASVGPVALNMAGIAHPETAMLPFMTMATACASSFAYCLVIGTPPNAIVYASGLLTPRDYLRVGIPLWFMASIVLVLLIQVYWMSRGFAGLPAF